MQATIAPPLDADEASTPVNSRGKVIVASLVGTAIEFFDFYIYATAAVIVFPHIFFPQGDPTTATLQSLATFAVAFVARPIGSALFGHFGDRVGRKVTLVASLLTMGISTVLIGLLPSYETIGIFAPILLALARFGQGLGLGGEWGGAALLATENAPAKKRALYGSFPQLGAPIGFFFANGTFLLLSWLLSDQQFMEWGWRVPFIIGLLIIPVGIYIRKHLEETYSGEAPAHARPPLNPVWDLVSNHAKDLLLGVLIIMSGTVMVYVVLLYMPTYMMQTYHIAGPTAYLFSCIASVVQIIAVYCAGRYVDRVQNYKRPLLFSIFAALILIYPTFWFLSATQTLWLAIVFRILLIGALGINMLASTMLIVSALPRHVRATGTSMIYAFGVTLFGGSAQLVVTWLLDVSGNPMAPAWYVTGMLTVSLIATLLFRERHKE